MTAKLLAMVLILSWICFGLSVAGSVSKDARIQTLETALNGFMQAYKTDQQTMMSVIQVQNTILKVQNQMLDREKERLLSSR